MRAIRDGCDRPDDLRRRIERLDGLPLRPATVRQVLTPSSPPTPLDEKTFAEVDPGWALASGSGGVDPLEWIAEKPWWPAPIQQAAPALDRLWKHGVAASFAARRMARESNDPDPEAVARAGLLHRLGDWLLALADPEAYARWLGIADPARRRDREVAWLGTDLATLARDTAERWGCEPCVVDAVWLHGHATGDLLACAEDPARLALIRQAHDWAERTPWALSTETGRGPCPPDPRVRLLIAEVQVRCVGEFVAPDASPHEERLARSHARLKLSHDRLRRSEAERDRLLITMAESHPREAAAETSLLDRARLAWSSLIDRQARTERRLAGAIEAHRIRVVRDEQAQSLAKLAALAEFAAGAGHELNNPLAVILGRAQLLMARHRDPDSLRSLRAIIGQAQRAHRILRDLMYVARPSIPRPRPCWPDDIVRACLNDLKHDAELRGVHLVGETRDPGPRAWADPEPLRHAADVLVRNALEATPRGGSVRVVVDGDSRRLCWAVHDEGRGIDSDEGPHLFDPFYCGRQAGRGLGLGLPRIARFVAQAGGELRWQSQSGRGTSFLLSLPLAAEDGTGSVAL